MMTDEIAVHVMTAGTGSSTADMITTTAGGRRMTSVGGAMSAAQAAAADALAARAMRISSMSQTH